MSNGIDFKDAKVFTGEPQAGGDLLSEGKSLVKSEASYHTAISVMKPRSLDAVVAAVKREAMYGGDDFYYRWPVKTKTGKTQIIEGGTIGLALAIAREWTNCAIPLEVEEKNGKWIFTASFVDLERGFTITRTFRQKIPTQPLGKYDLDRWQDMAFQKGQSQAIRNVIFNGVPRWLRSEALQIAKESALNKITKEGIDTARTKAVEFLGQYGIDEDRIKAVMGKELNELLPDDIQTLRNIATQIQNGDISPEKAFPVAEEETKSSIEKKLDEMPAQTEEKLPKEPPEQKRQGNVSERDSKSKQLTISEYHKQAAKHKIRIGEEQYYSTLETRGMKSAADAKTKQMREGVLRALETLPDTQKEDLIECPNTGDMMKADYCNGGDPGGCKQREGCPAWDNEEAPPELTPEKAEQMALELAEQVGKLPNQDEAHAWGVKAESIMAQIKQASPEAFDIVSKAMEAKKVEFENIL